MEDKGVKQEETVEELNLDDVEFDKEAIEEVKNFEKALDKSTNKIIIGSAIALGIVMLSAIIIVVIL